MVEFGNIALKEDLISVIDQALDAGVDAGAFAEMIAERIAHRTVENPTDIVNLLVRAETPPKDEGAVIYDELPDGLIDLPTASKKYGVKVRTAAGWWHRGLLPRIGKLRAPAAGGGYNVTVEDAFKEMATCPRGRGRPPKSSVG